MKGKLGSLVVGVLVGATLVAIPWEGTSEAGTGRASIRITDSQIKVTRVDIGQKGTSPGDVEIVRQRLFNRRLTTRPIGRAELVCTFVDNRRARVCRGTYFLPRGNLVVGGSLRFRQFYGLAVVGGTGLFDNARGTLTVTRTARNPVRNVVVFRGGGSPRGPRGGPRYALPMAVDRDEVLRALEHVIDPELRRPVTELDMVRDVEIDGASVSVTIALTVAGCPLRSSFQDQVAQHVGSVPGVGRVELRFDVMSTEEKQALTTKLRGGRPEKSISLDPATRVIAVASGKGGVGKSSLTVNLAASLDSLGQSVGLIDADIYGHSIPHMLGVHQRPVVVDRMIVPPVRGRLKFISIGSFLDDNAPVMWRGPMLHKALEQFLSDVHWGELDTIVVDMPPGTGDMAISLAQLLPRAEVLVVTTPQPAAQQVAVRAAQMAVKSGMRLLGVVENMSYLVGTGQELFGSGGGQALADEVGAPLLGSVPLDPLLREAADAGIPVVERDPGSEAARAIVAIAESVAAPRPGAIRKPLTVLS